MALRQVSRRAYVRYRRFLPRKYLRVRERLFTLSGVGIFILASW